LIDIPNQANVLLMVTWDIRNPQLDAQNWQLVPDPRTGDVKPPVIKPSHGRGSQPMTGQIRSNASDAVPCMHDVAYIQCVYVDW